MTDGCCNNGNGKKERKNGISDTLIHAARSHPFITLALACLCFTAFNLPSGKTVGLIPQTVFLGAVIVLLTVLAAKAYLAFDRRTFMPFALMCALYAVITCYIMLFMYNVGLSVAVAGVCVAAALGSYWKAEGTLTARRAVFLLFIIGFAVRAAYVILTGHLIRQHDAGGTNGHIPYIEYIYNNRALPTVKASGMNQNYHPPLHYIISALWLRVQTLLFGDGFYGSALENLQILTLFYSSAAMIVARRLFGLVGIKGKGLTAAFAVVALHPTFFILAGSVNNDMLSVLFSLTALMLAVKWYKNPTMSGILRLALAIGLGMMTKLSVATVAPAVAVLFAVKFFQSRLFGRLIAQFSAFAAVSFPLGLWWGVRNLIKSGVPITYVPVISKKSPQYIAEYPAWRRIFDIRTADVWMARGERYGYTHYEYNIPLALMKTSVFGEYYTGKSEPLLSVIAYILAIANLLLAAAALVYMLRFVFRKSAFLDGGLRAFFGVLYASLIGFYVKFCFDYPYDCTQDFRYIVPVAVIGALFLGLGLTDRPGAVSPGGTRARRAVSYALYVTVALFGIASVLLYVSFKP